MKIKLMEFISVLFASFLTGIFVSHEWDQVILLKISSIMFSFFLPSCLPGIVAVMALGGDYDNVSETHFILGVMLQGVFLWLLVRVIYSFKMPMS